NGRFLDNPDDPLEGWTYIFTDNTHYMENHKHVWVVSKDKYLFSATTDTPNIMSSPNDPERWLRLDGRDKKWTWEVGGIQIYSPIIRYDPKKSYKVTVRARSLHAWLPGVDSKGGNPSSRIYPILYGWNAKAQKSNEPQISDLHEGVRLQPMYFDGKSVTGAHSGLQTAWKTVSVTIPSHDRSEMMQRKLEDCMWLAVKFLVMDGGELNTGYLDIAEVKVEEMGPVNEVKITPGAGTKGADGKSYSSGSSGTKTLTPVGPVPVNKKK
ncbi:MAG: hypothetical protein FWH21_01830, partial [Kiritimatiellaeota bacterium]|nr:hypothetical protein [Kiritimatiellota bacterium]